MVAIQGSRNPGEPGQNSGRSSRDHDCNGSRRTPQGDAPTGSHPPRVGAVEPWLSVPFNRREFVARLSQTHCRTGRKRVSTRFGSRISRGRTGVFRTNTRFLGFCRSREVRNGSVFPGVFCARCVRRTHVLKNRNVGNSSAIFSRAVKKRVLEWRATQSYIVGARGKGCRARPWCEARNEEGL